MLASGSREEEGYGFKNEAVGLSEFPPVGQLRGHNSNPLPQRENEDAEMVYSTSPAQLKINQKYTLGTGKKARVINELVDQYNAINPAATQQQNGQGQVNPEDLRIQKVHLLEKLRKEVKSNLADKTADSKPGKLRGFKNKISGVGDSNAKKDQLSIMMEELKEELRNVGADTFTADTLEHAASTGDAAKKGMGKSMKRLYKEMYLKKVHSNRLLGLIEIGQLKDIEAQQQLGSSFLEDEVKTGTYLQAIQYINKRDFKDWLKIHPNKRLLITSLVYLKTGGVNIGEINLSQEELIKTPAYAMSLSLSGSKSLIRDHTTSNWEKTMKGGNIDFANLSDKQKVVITKQIEEHEAKDDGFLKKKAKKLGYQNTPLNAKDIEDKIEQFKTRNDNALRILKKVFVLLQAGLKERTKEGDYKTWSENVSTALSHGGRVNIKIPKLAHKDQNPKELLDWLEITQKGHKNKDAGIVKRSFGTHHMEINDKKGVFKEKGGKGAALKNKLGKTEIYGLDLAVGGFGNIDFNGEFILPDGANGHMFIGFKAPTLKDSGGLEIGIETTGPGAHSNVGYVHNWNSTEATANPLSSSGGAKADKHGHGKLDWSRIDLTDLEVPFTNKIDSWLAQLNQMEALFDQMPTEGNLNNKLLAGKKITNA